MNKQTFRLIHIAISWAAQCNLHNNILVMYYCIVSNDATYWWDDPELLPTVPPYCVSCPCLLRPAMCGGIQLGVVSQYHQWTESGRKEEMEWGMDTQIHQDTSSWTPFIATLNIGFCWTTGWNNKRSEDKQFETSSIVTLETTLFWIKHNFNSSKEHHYGCKIGRVSVWRNLLLFSMPNPWTTTFQIDLQLQRSKWKTSWMATTFFPTLFLSFPTLHPQNHLKGKTTTKQTPATPKIPSYRTSEKFFGHIWMHFVPSSRLFMQVQDDFMEYWYSRFLWSIRTGRLAVFIAVNQDPCKNI